MRKSFTVLGILFIVVACSHKTTSTIEKTSSTNVTHEQYLQGKMVFEANCQKCHKLRDPHSHTVTQWVKWLDKMAPKAKLTPEQKQQVFNFVSVNAKGT